MKLSEPSYDIKTWKGFDHFKYIMDNIAVGCHVVIVDYMNFDEVQKVYIDKKCIVTEIKECDNQLEQEVDPLCQVCIGEIGVDGHKPDCWHYDDIHEKEITTYIKAFFDNEFIEADEMEI